MKPGRKLDALVAEKVMGLFKPVNRVDLQFGDNTWSNGTVLFYLPEYSTDIAAAWEVVEKIFDLTQHSIVVWRLKDLGYCSCLNDKKDPDWIENGESAPHAICLAAVTAVGDDVSELDKR